MGEGAFCTMKLSPQIGFDETLSSETGQALGELNALQELSVYPVSEDEKTNGSYEKSVKQKIA